MDKKAKYLLAYLLISIPVTLLITYVVHGGNMSLRTGLVTVTGCFVSFAIISMVAMMQGKGGKGIN